ncbi:DUF86 domain-containing protein [Candidatus Roizmanbacteria bacterium CG07_land_8_20_14_0_80_34_15]|uniref:DUF86 domain-containing protein n=1 Tax=Candidatus Roizmanbacteria bacterium CG07_land_8_20_14_0_80_34_15 TaxID=1974849 RepID=A0A2M6YU59_9BACT|nr:MAG: DUF86 domain-containing protein [Candidatus Roizmanbacteria bacterium CG07_land_8_20_14_0_80_34_15]
MKKDFIVYIEDIIESIQKIEEYTGVLSKEEFEELVSIQDAVLMRLAVIGESANKIPVDVRKINKIILWRKIINLRNLIVHDYSSVNIERIWKIIQKELPVFKKQIADLLEKTSK